MRTVLTIAKEAVKALEEANKHYNECNICLQGKTCIGYHFLLNNAETFRLKIERAEATFQQELKERGIEL